MAAYIANADDAHVRLEHLVRPDPAPKFDLYHFLVFHVDGERISVEYVGLPSGRKIHPYPAVPFDLADSPAGR